MLWEFLNWFIPLSADMWMPFFADIICKWRLSNETCHILMKIASDFVPKGPANNTSAIWRNQTTLNSDEEILPLTSLNLKMKYSNFKSAMLTWPENHRTLFYNVHVHPVATIKHDIFKGLVTRKFCCVCRVCIKLGTIKATSMKHGSSNHLVHQM